MKKKVVSMACGLSLVPFLMSHAMAQPDGDSANPSADRYGSFDLIPDPLRMMLEQVSQTNRERFMSEAMLTTLTQAADKRSLTRQDVERVHQQEIHDRQLKQLQEIQKYDVNL